MARNRGLPHYRRVLSLLLTALQDGTLQKLPSERALAQRHRIARGTARRALEELKTLGYAQRIQGSGTYARHQSARQIYFFGYGLASTHYAQLCQHLRRRVEEAGLTLITLDTGHQGELLEPAATLLPQLREAEALIWYVPSDYRGRLAAMRLRRRLPVRFPLVLIDDPLGLALHGTHRFDLLHFDNAMAARHLVSILASRKIHHPVLLRRSDVKLFSTKETQRGFLAGLADQGIDQPERHFMDWNPEQPESFPNFMREPREWQPDAFLLGYDYKNAFLAACTQFDTPFPKELPLFAFGNETIGSLRMARNYHLLADACADLILSRLQRPNRANTHTTVAIPVRERRGKNVHPDSSPSPDE